MNPIEKFLSRADEIEKKLGYHFQDRNLLVIAFTHRSFINEYRELTESHNERLEFLGDSVLGLLIAERLYRERPNTPEGELSTLRSQLVQASACTHYLEKIDVGPYVLLGKGEQLSQGRGRESIYANLFEAIIGAIFLDGGLKPASQFLFENFSVEFGYLTGQSARNWKAELQDYTQKTYQKIPSYVVIEESGPDHAKHFVIEVQVDGKMIGKGKGPSKKEAQQDAAKDALE